MRKISRTIARALRDNLALYCAMDDYGTRQYCWTEGEALAWLPAMSSNAVVFRGSVIIAGRVHA